MRRRTFLLGIGGAAGMGFGIDLADGDFDAPYRIGGMAFEFAGEHVAPGEEIPDSWIEASQIPDTYQDYIDPEIEAGIETFDELAYERDLEWKRPEEYLADEKGDCEDYAIAVASVLEHYDIPAKVVLGSLDGNGHVVAEDAYGMIYSVNEERAVPELEGWEPSLEFSQERPMQGYTGTGVEERV